MSRRLVGQRYTKVGAKVVAHVADGYTLIRLIPALHGGDGTERRVPAKAIPAEARAIGSYLLMDTGGGERPIVALPSEVVASDESVLAYVMERYATDVWVETAAAETPAKKPWWKLR